jgi:hypothetical protein
MTLEKSMAYVIALVLKAALKPMTHCANRVTLMHPIKN